MSSIGEPIRSGIFVVKDFFYEGVVEVKEKIESPGKCNFCGQTFEKGNMTRHLKSCEKRKDAAKTPSKGVIEETIFHIVAEGDYSPEYWIHIEMPAHATLDDLDGFLRDIWLECCGHLSSFTIDGRDYHPEDEGGPGASFIDVFSFIKGGKDRHGVMSDPVGKVLKKGLAFKHDYDFGSTTRLKLRVVSEREGTVKGEPVKLLARNLPPPILCGSCGKQATQVCTDCIYGGSEAWLCKKCAKKHGCGEDMFLPVVNSPRVGVCGYCG